MIFPIFSDRILLVLFMALFLFILSFENITDNRACVDFSALLHSLLYAHAYFRRSGTDSQKSGFAGIDHLIFETITGNRQLLARRRNSFGNGSLRDFNIFLRHIRGYNLLFTNIEPNILYLINYCLIR